LGRAPVRGRVYYVAFAREFKHTKDFCVPRVSGWSSSGTTLATLRDGIAKGTENAPSLFAKEKAGRICDLTGALAVH